MSELTNPLFDNEREFLERQKEEYKNALMGDVDQIKSQGQEIGKKVAMAGGVLLAGLLVKRMFSGGGKDKEKSKAEKNRKKRGKKHDADLSDMHIASASASRDKTVIYHQQDDEFFMPTEQVEQREEQQSAKKKAGSFLTSSVGKALQQQALALVVVYATKKLEDYLQSVSENDDIAATPVVEVTEIETTEYIVPEKDAF
ncbi:hypothetical protein [Pontibacter akesuensis]|uniref:Uncharacterized protein n=1 Tax=Pontibacter akesuensis TaxID=388950 RepID=A0A1I7HXN6_9BACT|nr:hypothetical protein [Pontibacter akesuensis]GHA64083.1 hypothetical protein GCM10007389_15930 [Pontibacter akesuensis]SFU65484.1 hypothetical protein SAMN04487941_1754 [Pontibacter akesuensis]